MYVIKFKKAIGEIPKDALGFFFEESNYTRVWIPRQYTGLSKNLMPCYMMPIKNKQYMLYSDDWERVQDLTDIEKQQLNDLENEIKEKWTLYIGPSGVMARTMGNIDLLKDKLKDIDFNGEK
jgi:hypothetical protein